MLTYQDIYAHLPELTYSLRKHMPYIFDCELFESGNIEYKNSVAILAVTFIYNKPTGFRNICVLSFQKNGEIIIINKIPAIERCLLWAYRIRNCEQRSAERIGLIRRELYEKVFNPWRTVTNLYFLCV